MYIMFSNFIKRRHFNWYKKLLKIDFGDPIDKIHLKRSEGLKSYQFRGMTLLCVVLVRYMHNLKEWLWTDSRLPYSIGSRKWTNLTTCQRVVVCTNNVCKTPHLKFMTTYHHHPYLAVMVKSWTTYDANRKLSQASCMAGQKTGLSTQNINT